MKLKTLIVLVETSEEKWHQVSLTKEESNTVGNLIVQMKEGHIPILSKPLDGIEKVKHETKNVTKQGTKLSNKDS